MDVKKKTAMMEMQGVKGRSRTHILGGVLRWIMSYEWVFV
jgi:hypothetical protein